MVFHLTLRRMFFFWFSCAHNENTICTQVDSTQSIRVSVVCCAPYHLRLDGFHSIPLHLTRVLSLFTRFNHFPRVFLFLRLSSVRRSLCECCFQFLCYWGFSVSLLLVSHFTAISIAILSYSLTETVLSPSHLQSRGQSNHNPNTNFVQSYWCGSVESTCCIFQFRNKTSVGNQQPKGKSIFSFVLQCTWNSKKQIIFVQFVRCLFRVCCYFFCFIWYLLQLAVFAYCALNLNWNVLSNNICRIEVIFLFGFFLDMYLRCKWDCKW